MSGSTLFQDSRLAEQAWQRRRGAARRWAAAGAACGALAGIVAFAPASWLAAAITGASGGRLLLADARGTTWSGSAVPVLTGGPDSRSAALVPGRLAWTFGLHGLTPELRLRQPCCIDGTVRLRLRFGLRSLALELPADAPTRATWPAAWLAGLGAPWNSLQLGGTLRVSSPGLHAQRAAGRWQLEGRADLQLDDLRSRLSTLDRLGSYRLRIDAEPGQPTRVQLTTLDGALQMQGDGQWTGAQLRFRGQAYAAPGFESALDNLLNILGKRQGALSLLAIG